MRERGMKFREIAEELGMNMSRVNHDLEKGRGRKMPQTTIIVSQTAPTT
jgi:hypothetical protein